MSTRISLILVLFSFLVTGCKTGSKATLDLRLMPIVLQGSFTDDYGSNYVISGKEWQHGKNMKYHLLHYDKTGNFLIARNDDANPTEPGLYTRIDITFFKNAEPWLWGYCLTAYDASTLKTAMETPAADSLNPRKGCNGYPFTRMKRK